MSFEEVHHLKIHVAAMIFPCQVVAFFFWKPRGGAVWEVPQNQLGCFLFWGARIQVFFQKKKKGGRIDLRFGGVLCGFHMFPLFLFLVFWGGD